MRPSITSLVWSHDDKATQYAAFSGIQHPRVEIIDGLKDMVKKAINLFGLKNKAPPEKIIFYRDGVSDGEFEEVGQTEIAAIKCVCVFWTSFAYALNMSFFCSRIR